MESFRLTQFSPGAGCGCKISPEKLTQILTTDVIPTADSRLLVGNSTRDDAAVYDLGDGTALISTTDFFTPIVDDPFDFGRIAATNALSDVYAMGGRPILAIAILGWPLDKLPVETARKVIEGARSVCGKVGVTIAGGHSIDIGDPIFGLSVNGVVRLGNIKRNDTATADSLLFLTKPLGIGILTTAEKKGLLANEDKGKSVDLMCRMNSIGEQLSLIKGINAMTDVTGFGLLGHLTEVCMGSNVSAEIWYDKVPKIEGIESYIEKKSFPGGTFRNWSSYGKHIGSITEEQKMLLCDPQTSGGLLISVDRNCIDEVNAVFNMNGLNIEPIGRLTERGKDLISIM